MENTLQQRLDAIRRRMAEACLRAGRDPATVRLLPVSKTFGPGAVREASEAGLDAFGENRVQEAMGKIPLCPARLQWHLIGHLQSNKARQAARLFTVVHSVDSLPLLEKLDAAAAEEGRRIDVLLQIDVSGEATKFGMPPGEAPAAVTLADSLPHLVLKGLMTIPPWDPEPEQVRPFFKKLRELRDSLQERTGTPLPDLSMGMSGDFEAAIAEGATWIRVGSALFGPRRPGEET
jgi:pyridoxal phosphate enzyme (YggS family)